MKKFRKVVVILCDFSHIKAFSVYKCNETISLNLCLDDRIGLSGMIVYHLLYLLLVFSGVTCIFLSKLSLGIKI